MSQWVKVFGLVEFGWQLSKKELVKLEKQLGTPSTRMYDSVGSIPCGSEGSIQYTITQIRKLDDSYNTCVIIKGNLRDRSSEEFIESIRDWFKKVVYHKDFYTDEFFLEISGLNYEIIRYKDEDEIKYNPRHCEVCDKQLHNYKEYWSGLCNECQPLEGED